MCGRVALYAPVSRIREVFAVDTEGLAYAPRYNIGPMQMAPVIRQRPTGERVAQLLRWGLVPYWSKDESIATKLINARAETLAEKPSFREAYRSRRCIIPVNGFYEWKRLAAGKEAFFIHPGDGELFGLAGLWERWRRPGGEPLDTFTVITTAANAAMALIHERMPLILGPDDFAAWLAPTIGADALRELMNPCPPDRLAIHPVGKAIGNVRNEGPGLIEPLSASMVRLP